MRLTSRFRLNNLLAGRWRRRFILLIEGSLLVVLTYQLAIVTWTFLQPEQSLENTQQKPGKLPDRAVQKSAYPELVTFRLFDQEPVALTHDNTQTVNLNDIPKSRLAVKVVGIVASTPPTRSVAIMQIRGKDRTYRIGENLEGTSAELVDVYDDRVIILNQGKHEALFLYPEESDKPVPARNNSSLSGVREVLISDPTSFSEFVQIVPVEEEGRLSGYQISPGKQPELFHRAGLKAGDLVRSINGINLNKEDLNVMSILGELSKASRLSMTIERDGRLYDIDVAL